MTCCEPLFGGLNLSCDTLVTIEASRRPHPRRARTYQEFRMILFFLLHCWSNSAKASHSKEMTLEEAMAVAINIHCSSESELAPRCLKLAWGSLIAIHLRGGQVMGERRLSGLWSVGHILAWSPPHPQGGENSVTQRRSILGEDGWLLHYTQNRHTAGEMQNLAEIESDYFCWLRGKWYKDGGPF